MNGAAQICNKRTIALQEQQAQARAAAEAAVATAFAPTVLKGKDKLGRPIVYTALGTIYLPALAKKGATLAQLLRCANREMERMRLEVEASADPLAGLPPPLSKDALQAELERERVAQKVS